MFNKKGKSKNVEYTGDIIVCLDIAYRFHELKDGRKFIGNLANIKIRPYNLSNYIRGNEYTLAVPVFICNKNEQNRENNVDWTRSNSPITEIKYKPLQRWWPKSMFRGVSRIGEEEEVIIEYSNFSIKLRVIYAFSSELKKLFADIEEVDVDDDKLIRYTFETHDDLSSAESVDKQKMNLLPECPRPNVLEKSLGVIDENVYIKNDNNKEIIPTDQDKPKGKLKIAIGASILMAVSLGLFYGIKLLIAKKDS
jgi:hypothetical protein